MKHFDFTLRTPDEDLFSGKVTEVTLTTEMGELQLLAEHSSLTGSVLFSSVKVADEDKEEVYMARNGIISFDNGSNSGSLLAIHCEKKSEMNLQTAKEYLQFIKEKLDKGEDLSSFQVDHLEGERVAVEEQIKVVEG